MVAVDTEVAIHNNMIVDNLTVVLRYGFAALLCGVVSMVSHLVDYDAGRYVHWGAMCVCNACIVTLLCVGRWTAVHAGTPPHAAAAVPAAYLVVLGVAVAPAQPA